ncbi:MAG: C40 family peptidase [Desulfobaccales bacterium]
MARRMILVVSLGLALILLPKLVLAVPTKGTAKKASASKSKSSEKSTESRQVSKSSSKSPTSKEKVARSSSKRRYSSSRRSVEEDYADETPPYTPAYQSYKASIGETKPLMKVIPQRDGRFLLEPLTPKPKVGPISGSPSSSKDKSDVVPGGRGYNLYEPWNFRELVLTMAKSYEGTRYSYGSSLQHSNATDCSGFVQYIYKGFQINLPRSSAEQAEVGQTVAHTMDFSKLVPGDLLFFSRGGRYVGHAGIYLGEGKMIHASNYREGVTITDLRNGSYPDRFVVAKRVFEVSYLK